MHPSPALKKTTSLVQAMDRYRLETLSRKQKADLDIDQYVNEFEDEESRQTRFRSCTPMRRTPRAIDDLKIVQGWITASEDTDFITTDEYAAVVSDTSVDAEELLLVNSTFSHSVIYTDSWAKAAQCLELCPQRRPIVIQDENGPEPAIPLNRIIGLLRHAQKVSVHDLAIPREKHGEFLLPTEMVPDELVRRLYDDHHFPVSCLDLAGMKPSHLPLAMWGLESHDGLWYIREEMPTAGKRERYVVRDLSDSASFTLLANRFAVSLWHRDSEHVATIVECQSGSKLWGMLPYMAEEQLVKFITSGHDDKPPVKPFLVHLKRGTTLIMPPGTIHFVLTDGEDEPTACTGAKVWDLRLLHQVPKAISFEEKFPAITNEAKTQEVLGKLKLVGEYWVQGSSVFKFPASEHYPEFQRDLKEMEEQKERENS
jgi:hypothetical protein